MSTDKDDDLTANLAFMKAMVSEGPRVQVSAGLLFLVAGLVYGLVCLVYVWQIRFNVQLSPAIWLTLSIAPTAIFFVALGYVIWRDRKIGNHGVATRAVNASYGSAGLANLFVSITFGYVAITEKMMLIWLLYPIAMCIFQGSVWYIAFMVRKKVWLLGASVGWFLTSLLLAWLIRDTGSYLLVLGIALISLMGGSGFYMMRTAKAD